MDQKGKLRADTTFLTLAFPFLKVKVAITSVPGANYHAKRRQICSEKHDIYN
jgi:hypothetical protein